MFRKRLLLRGLLAVALFYAGLALAVFPADRQLYKYPLAADQLLTGTLAPERVLDFSPLYILVHAAAAALAHALGAEGPTLQIVVVHALQVLAAAGSVALTFLLLETLFPIWVAVSGAAALLLNRSVQIYASVFEPEVFLLFGLLSFLYLSQRPGRTPRLLAGCALAFAVALRPSVLPLLLVVPVYYAAKEGRRSWMSASVLVCAPVVLVLFLLALRNGAATGSFSPLGMNPGFVFFEGNNPVSSGRSAVYPPLVAEVKNEIGDQPDSPHIAYRLIAERSVGRPLSASEANAFWRARALAFVADEPGRFLGRTAGKVFSAFHEYRRHDLVTAQAYDRRLRALWIPAAPLAILSALALIGVIPSLQEWRRLLPVYALLGSQLLTMATFYVSDRQRLPLIPALIVLACAALARLQSVSWPRRAAAAGVVAALGVAFTSTGHLAREDRHIWAAYEARDPLWLRAFELRDQGYPEESAQAAVRAHASAPWLRDFARPAGVPFGGVSFEQQALDALGPQDSDPSRQLDRAQLLIQAHRLSEAEKILSDLVDRGERFDRGFLQSSEPSYYLARIAVLGGDRARAVELLADAAELAPGDPFVRAQLASLTSDRTHEEIIGQYFSEVDARFLVGVAQLENETQDLGVANLSEVVERVPELWRPRIYLSAALGAQGDQSGALEQYREAMALRRDPVMLEDRIVPIFAAAANAGPGNPRVRYDYGIVLAQFGRFGEALIELRAANDAAPSAETRSAIAEVERMLTQASEPSPGANPPP